MAGKNRIVIQQSRNKQFFVDIKAKNNKNIAATETYKTRAGAENAVNVLKKIIKNPEVIDKTKGKNSK